MLSDNKPYHLHFGDCITHMATMPAASMDCAIFSPPFAALFAYTSSPSDLGNCELMNGSGDAALHLSFFYRQIARVVKPGRVIMVHVMQIPRLKRAGESGTHDYRGLNIRLGERAGLIYEYDWLITKNPQTQAIRTKSHKLQFAGMERDRANCCGAFGDYLIKFQVPGENAVPIDSAGEVTRENWIDWAEAAWTDIRQTNTLNTKEAKGEGDTKHICPLQLDVIERLVKLYSNPGEVVFSPFAGIGSEGYVAIRHGRRFYGCELKREYYDTAMRNLECAINDRSRADAESLFSPEGAAA